MAARFDVHRAIRVGLFMCAALLLLLGVGASAQEATWLDTHIEFGPGLRDMGQAFERRVRREFESLGIRLREQEVHAPPQLYLALFEYRGQIVLHVDPLLAESFLPSPLLAMNLESELVAMRLQLDRGEQWRLASLGADIAVAFGLYVLNDCERAMPYFERAIRTIPFIQGDPYSESSLHFLFANCLLARTEFERATRHYMEAMRPEGCVASCYDGVSIRGSANLAWTYLQMGQPDDAMAVMDRLVEGARRESRRDADPRPEIRALQLRAALAALAFRYDQAIGDMDAAIALATTANAQSADSPRPLSNRVLATLHDQRGQYVLLLYEWDRVLDDYNRAIALDPTYAVVYFHRGVLYYTQGPRENALADFERYLELEPDGEFADEARHYLETIPVELEALE